MKNNTTPTVPASTVATTEIKPIRTKHLAARFSVKPTHLRRILRSMKEYADGVHTNYAWAENDKAAFAAIKAQIDKLEADKKARAAAAKEALDKRAKAAATQAKVDAAIA